MTAAPNVSEQELLGAGFVACLFKPMSDKDLINTARKCVNGKIAEKQIDFSMLLTYGNEKETLENFVKEMTDTLVGCPVRCSEKQMLKSPVKLLI